MAILLALIAGLNKAMQLFNPGIFKTEQALNKLQILLAITILLILTGVYTWFYLPDGKKITSNQKVEKSSQKPEDNKALAMVFGFVVLVASFALVFYGLQNVFIAILIAVSLSIFTYDVIKPTAIKEKLKAGIASFNACFINTILVIGFAFSGINRIHGFFMHDPAKFLNISFANMPAGTGILLLLIGFAGIYSSRTRTGKSIKEFIDNFWGYFNKKNIDWFFLLMALAVAIQGAYLTYLPTKELMLDWGIHNTPAIAIAVTVLVLTFIAIFALLIPPPKKSTTTGNNQIQEPLLTYPATSAAKGSFKYVKLVITTIAAVLTGIATLPFQKNCELWQIIFWSIIAVSVSALFIRRFNPVFFAGKAGKSVSADTIGASSGALDRSGKTPESSFTPPPNSNHS